ncbi:hypothetical protein [Chelatococcus composti]|jgi:hypothetical protein|uniref:Uncharacterized protein n=1 Tax=Chelatococcus composti TaxID=1743235 RepID=A0A841K552_9HYPH|nr:hypothetical protein [Chelatococcus composti]MBB6167130.1 hypothetical protein [Chelatococcus composti]MBS7735339.1 hypothetical protein [Chelatococcus composti]
MDDFSKAPMSIGEIRASRELDGSKWTPRDVLVSLLREIDAGERQVDTIFVAFANGDEVGYRQSSPGAVRTVGVIEHAKMLFMED